jgi:hypothetical protein
MGILGKSKMPDDAEIGSRKIKGGRDEIVRLCIRPPVTCTLLVLRRCWQQQKQPTHSPRMGAWATAD